MNTNVQCHQALTSVIEPLAITQSTLCTPRTLHVGAVADRERKSGRGEV